MLIGRRRLLSLGRRPVARGPGLGTLVCVFLRGGADGLSLVPPVHDDDYRRLRPTLALAPARAGAAASEGRALDLDGTFGLHPSLAPLLPLFRQGRLAIVHAVGSDDTTRSHFEAQDRMEHAGAAGRPEGSGWLARWLAAGRPATSLSAVALGTDQPESLRGAPALSVFERADEQRVGAGDRAYLDALAALCGTDRAFVRPARDAIDTLDRLRALPAANAGAGYPDDVFGRRLSELARVLRAGLEVRAACVDLDGWDTHFVQASGLSERARVLAEGLAAFDADVRGAAGPVTVLVMTEFGRRAYENGSLGTDHGRGSVLFALGAGVRGGRVHGPWPGLHADALAGPGDLAVATDYRAVLAELLERRDPEVPLASILPDAPRARLGVFEPLAP